MSAMDKLESLLESYYGMQDEETAARDAHDVDSTAFDVASLASEVLSAKTLPELMSYNRELHRETRGLDESMQNLVYNNYNKFISATDTIRRMKDSVGEMESKMGHLSTGMKEMGGSSATVNASLQENRGKIEKLVGVKRLLLKLEFLFELPLRLKRSIELEAQGQAVKYYTMVSGVLHKYDHIPSLHKIRIEADAIINGLRNDLRAILRDTRSSGSVASTSGKVVEAIKLLVQLEEPRPALRAAYLSYQRARLLTALSTSVAKYAPANPTGGSSAPLSLPTETSSMLSSRAQALYTAAVAARSATPGAHALATPRPRATVSAYIFLQSLNRAFLDSFKVAAELYVELFEETADSGTVEGVEERKVAHDDLVAFTKELLGEYFVAVRKQLSLPPPIATGSAGSGSGSGASGGEGSGGGGGGGAPRPPSTTHASAEAQALAGKKNPFLAKPNKRNQQAQAQLDTGAEGDDDAELLAAAEKAKSQALAAAASMTSHDASPDNRFATVTDALQLLLTDIRAAARYVREARLVDRAQEVTEAVLRAQLDGLFADVRVCVVHQLSSLEALSDSLLTEEKARATRAAAGAPTHPATGTDGTGSSHAAASGGGGGGSSTNPFGTPPPVRRPSTNPFGGPAAPPATATNPFGGPSAPAPTAQVPSSVGGAANPFGAPTKYDWIQTVGAGLAAAAEQSSSEVSRRLDDALYEAKPLVLNGMRLLPELARVFNSLIHGQVLHMLMWLASAWEALGDPYHPSRVEFAHVVVEADLGLEREVKVYPSSARGAAVAGARGGVGGHGRSGTAATGSGALKRRVAVNFAAAEADHASSPAAAHASASGKAETFTSGAALFNAEKNPAVLLLLAALCRHFSNNGVARALSTMLQSLPTRADLQAMGAASSDNNEMDAYGSMMDVPDLIKRMQGVGRELLRRYVFQHSQRLTTIVRRSMTAGNWLTHPEPRDVRVVVQVLLEDVAETKKLVGCTLGDWDPRAAVAASQAFGVGVPPAPTPTPSAASSNAPATAPASGNPFGPTNPFAAPPPPSTLRGGPSTGANPATLAAAQATRRTGLIVGGGGLTGSSLGSTSLSGLGATGARGGVLDIERLFRSSADSGTTGVKIVLGAVEYTSDSVIRILLRCVLKSFCEWIRPCMLGTSGYQQVQVDLATLHLALPYYTSPPPPASSSATAASAVSGGFDPYANAGPLEELINEAAVTAAERCIEPKPLESSILYKLASEKLLTINLPI